MFVFRINDHPISYHKRWLFPYCYQLHLTTAVPPATAYFSDISILHWISCWPWHSSGNSVLLRPHERQTDWWKQRRMPKVVPIYSSLRDCNQEKATLPFRFFICILTSYLAQLQLENQFSFFKTFFKSGFSIQVVSNTNVRMFKL